MTGQSFKVKSQSHECCVREVIADGAALPVFSERQQVGSTP